MNERSILLKYIIQILMKKGKLKCIGGTFSIYFGVDIHEVVVFEEAVKKFDGSQGFIDVFWK